MVGFEHPLGLMVVLLPEAEEALYPRLAMDAVLPLGLGPPGELSGFGRALEHLAGVEQRLHIDSVSYRGHVDRCPPSDFHAHMDCFSSASIERLYNTSRRAERAGHDCTHSGSCAAVSRFRRRRRNPVPGSTRPVRLDCGRELEPVRVAYETYGTLNQA